MAPLSLGERGWGVNAGAGGGVVRISQHILDNMRFLPFGSNRSWASRDDMGRPLAPFLVSTSWLSCCASWDVRQLVLFG